MSTPTLRRALSAPGLLHRKPLAREFEYKRQGTQTLIAALNVATGKVFAHCGETRTEEDFATFIEALIQQHPGYRIYHIVLDQISTHKSETLVRLAAHLFLYYGPSYATRRLHRLFQY